MKFVASLPQAMPRYAGPLAAVATGGAIVLLRIPMQEMLGAKGPFVTAGPAVMLAAFLGGFWPALLVLAVSLPVGQWAVTTAGAPPITLAAMVIYAAFGLVFALAGEMRLRGLRRARDYAARLASAQARMMQVSRLNAVGELAGSLAHELNQPLSAVSNYLGAAEQILARDGADPKAVELVRKAGQQAVRAGQIIARVRSGIERGEVVAAEESLREMAREAVEVAVAGGQREGVVIRYEFDRACDCVLADRTQVQQVILNLVRNALEAMAERPRRELCIGSRPAEEQPGFLDVHVADTGPGIPPDVAEHLFQPFVTSKSGGMGVGLSISRSIIEAHGGRLWATSNRDGGATFHFSLPSPRGAKETAAC